MNEDGNCIKICICNKQPKRMNGKHERRARPIVVKFTSYRTRHAVISRRRRLKGTDVAIQEQLTKANLQLLKSVKKIKNVLTAWSSDGRVIAKTPSIKWENNKQSYQGMKVAYILWNSPRKTKLCI